MGAAKVKAEQAQVAAAATGRVPISAKTTLRLARLWHEFQGANKAAGPAQAAVQAALVAYTDGLGSVVETLGLDVPIAVAGPDGSTRLQIEIDWSANELVLPPVAPTPTPPEPAKDDTPAEPPG